MAGIRNSESINAKKIRWKRTRKCRHFSSFPDIRVTVSGGGDRSTQCRWKRFAFERSPVCSMASAMSFTTQEIRRSWQRSGGMTVTSISSCSQSSTRFSGGFSSTISISVSSGGKSELQTSARLLSLTISRSSWRARDLSFLRPRRSAEIAT